MKQNKELWIVRITVLLSVLIGFISAYYTGHSFNRWFFKMDMVETGQQWLTFGIVGSLVLFIGGYVKGRYER